MSQTMSALTLAGMATTRSHGPFTGLSMKGKGPALLPYVPGSGGGPSGSRPGGPPGEEVEAPSLPLHQEHQQEVEES